MSSLIISGLNIILIAIRRQIWLHYYSRGASTKAGARTMAPLAPEQAVLIIIRTRKPVPEEFGNTPPLIWSIHVLSQLFADLGEISWSWPSCSLLPSMNEMDKKIILNLQLVQLAPNLLHLICISRLSFYNTGPLRHWYIDWRMCRKWGTTLAQKSLF